jgi:uroporphyrinogen decarboxylase
MTALAHKITDRIPIDLGATPGTGIHKNAYKKLMKLLGMDFTKEPVIINKMQQLVLPCEELLELLDIDVRGIYLGSPERSLEEEYPGNCYRDMWGVIRKIPEGGYYYDILESPFDKEEISLSEIENFYWPDADDPGFYEGVEQRVKELSYSDFAIVLNIGALIVHIGQFMRGFKFWYEDLILRPELLQVIMNHVTDTIIRIGKNAFELIGKYIDVVFLADDLGTQENLQFSPEIYRDLIKPFHLKICQFIRLNSRAKIFFHSCGSIFPLIGDLIDIGVDILNPVQVSAWGMDIINLKKTFGDKIIFWGAIDNQRLLPFGTEEDVKNNVYSTVQVLGKSGGYILCASHNLQPDVPPSNILAMYEAAKSFKLNQE